MTGYRRGERSEPWASEASHGRAKRAVGEQNAVGERSEPYRDRGRAQRAVCTGKLSDQSLREFLMAAAAADSEQPEYGGTVRDGPCAHPGLWRLMDMPDIEFDAQPKP